MSARVFDVPVLNVPLRAFELENGLRVTVSEDHAAPIVAVNLWYHVGSANEKPGRTGFAHLFEHMLFQGSEHVAANEHFELVQRAGGTLNGSTWLDRTNYFETLPSNQLSVAMWLEADRMGALLPAMTQQKLDTQRDVVKNERRWTIDNQPYGSWWERLPALCFPPDHPFHHSLIGSMDDLDAASLEDVSEFFRTFYIPSNAVLTVAGDASGDEVMELAAEFFGGIPRGQTPPSLAGMDVPARFGSWTRETVPDRVALPRVFLAFRSPLFGSAGYYAASITSAILGMKMGSRLHRRLVRQREIASNVSAFTFDLTKGADLLVIDATARQGVDVDALEGAVVEEVDTMARDGVTEQEVERAVALIATEFVEALQSAGERADLVSKFVTYFDDATQVNEQLAHYRAVGRESVMEFVRENLGEDNRVSLRYTPSAEVESTVQEPEG